MPEKDEATAGSLDLTSGGSWTISLDLRVTTGTTVMTATSRFTGSWTQSGGTLTLRDNADQTFNPAPYNNGPITTVKGGATLVFQK